MHIDDVEIARDHEVAYITSLLSEFLLFPQSCACVGDLFSKFTKLGLLESKRRIARVLFGLRLLYLRLKLRDADVPLGSLRLSDCTSLLCFVYKIDTIDVDGKPEVQFKRLKRLVGERGFEPPTPWSRKQNTNVDSASLNYQINCENWMRLAPKFIPKSDRGLTSVLYYEHRYARYILKTALEFCFVTNSREVNDAEPLLTLALIEAGSANPRS